MTQPRTIVVQMLAGAATLVAAAFMAGGVWQVRRLFGADLAVLVGLLAVIIAIGGVLIAARANQGPDAR